jgi:hypothetical protein
VEADRIGERALAGIRDRDSHRQSAGAQPVLDGESKPKRELSARVGVVAQGERGAVFLPAIDVEQAVGREAVHAHRIGRAVDPDLPSAAPTDDGEQDRARPRPPRRIGAPEKLPRADAPRQKLSASWRHDRSRSAMVQDDGVAHLSTLRRVNSALQGDPA